MKMFRATVNEISEIETNYVISEHVDVGIRESYAKTAAKAKQQLVEALQKRVSGGETSLKLALRKLEQAMALQVPE